MAAVSVSYNGDKPYPISFEGMVIEPGVIVLDDADGVLSVPRDAAEQIAILAQAKGRAEARQMEQTLAGQLDRAWLDVKLNQL